MSTIVAFQSNDISSQIPAEIFGKKIALHLEDAELQNQSDNITLCLIDTSKNEALQAKFVVHGAKLHAFMHEPSGGASISGLLKTGNFDSIKPTGQYFQVSAFKGLFKM